MKSRFWADGGVANPRDTCGYRCSLPSTKIHRFHFAPATAPAIVDDAGQKMARAITNMICATIQAAKLPASEQAVAPPAMS